MHPGLFSLYPLKGIWDAPGLQYYQTVCTYMSMLLCELKFFFFLNDFIYSFLERGREEEREGEKYQCVVVS